LTLRSGEVAKNKEGKRNSRQRKRNTKERTREKQGYKKKRGRENHGENVKKTGDPTKGEDLEKEGKWRGGILRGQGPGKGSGRRCLGKTT